MEYGTFRKSFKETRKAIQNPKDREVFVEKWSPLLEEAANDKATGLKKFSYVRYLYDLISPRLKRGKDISIMLIDIDNFKGVNEKHSYAEADSLLNHTGHILNHTLLERTSEILSENTRQGHRWSEKGIIRDIAARYHDKGDELLVVLYGTSKDGARAVADRIITEIRNDPQFKHYESGLSIGVASRNGDYKLEYLVSKAEEALKHVKRNGKNNYHFDDELAMQGADAFARD